MHTESWATYTGTTSKHHRSPGPTLQKRQTLSENLGFFFSRFAKSILPHNKHTHTHQMQPIWHLASECCKGSWKCAAHCTCSTDAVAQKVAICQTLQVALKYAQHPRSPHTNHRNNTKKKKTTTMRYILKWSYIFGEILNHAAIGNKFTLSRLRPEKPAIERNVRTRCRGDGNTHGISFRNVCGRRTSFAHFFQPFKNLVVKIFHRANFVPPCNTTLDHHHVLFLLSYPVQSCWTKCQALFKLHRRLLAPFRRTWSFKSVVKDFVRKGLAAHVCPQIAYVNLNKH